MSSDIQIFNNPQFGEIRTAGTAENPIFCLVDVCKVLDLDPSQVARRLDSSVFTKHPADTGFGIKEINFVNEDGLYDVILDSRKAEAKAFRKWVTSEVLPTIRKSGSYSTAVAALPDFTNPAEAARAWAEQYELKQIEAKRADEAEAQVLELSQEIETMKPKAAFTDAVSASNSSCLIGELAKILRQNGIEMGEKRLFGWMRNNGYLGKHGERYNIPNQEFIERGYFELKKGTRSGNNGVLYTTITPKVTGKGQVYFVNKFINKDLFLFC